MRHLDATRLLDAWAVSTRLRLHLRSVEIVMAAFAKRDCAPAVESEEYAIAGLLHDADWELSPADHPRTIVEWCRD